MMRPRRDYYEIMGLPPTASAAEIKKRYRELARKYHPDVMKDKSLGHRAFAQITEAYRTLSDPDARRAYDASRIPAPPRPSYGQPRARPAGPRPSQTPTARAPDPGKLVRDAEFAFISGRLGTAAGLCRQAIRLNRSNARAHAILGDIYRIQGRKEQAILEYSYAVQFNAADRDSQAKLEKLLGKAPRRRAAEAGRRRDVTDARAAAPSVNAANMAGWGLAFFLLFLINIYPGTPIPGVRYYLPSIASWSWNLIALLSLDAALVGFLLAVNRVVGHPDDDFLFEHVPGTMIPLGFPLLVFSAVFFYAAAGATLIVNFLQGTSSRSLACVFGAVTAITLLAGLMYEPGRAQVALFGGNIAFPSAVVGWYVGSLFGPVER